MRKTSEETVQLIGELSRRGFTPGQIAKEVHVSIPTVRTVLLETFEIMPDIRRALEEVRAPWKIKKMQLGEEVILGNRSSLLTAIQIAKRLNDVLFCEKYSYRRWIVIVNKEHNVVSIKRVG